MDITLSLRVIEYGSDLSVCTSTTGKPLDPEKRAGHRYSEHADNELNTSTYDCHNDPRDSEKEGRFHADPEPSPVIQGCADQLLVDCWCGETHILVEDFVHGRLSY